MTQTHRKQLNRISTGSHMLASVFCLACLLITPAAQADSLQSIFNNATKQLEAGHLEQAKKGFKKLRALGVRDEAVELNLAALYQRQQHSAHSLMHLERAFHYAKGKTAGKQLLRSLDAQERKLPKHARSSLSSRIYLHSLVYETPLAIGLVACLLLLLLCIWIRKLRPKKAAMAAIGIAASLVGSMACAYLMALLNGYLIPQVNAVVLEDQASVYQQANESSKMLSHLEAGRFVRVKRAAHPFQAIAFRTAKNSTWKTGFIHRKNTGQIPRQPH